MRGYSYCGVDGLVMNASILPYTRTYIHTWDLYNIIMRAFSYGGVDVLVMNAGILPKSSPIEDIDPARKKRYVCMYEYMCMCVYV